MLRVAGVSKDGTMSTDDAAVDGVLVAIAILDGEVAVKSGFE